MRYAPADAVDAINASPSRMARVAPAERKNFSALRGYQCRARQRIKRG